MARRHRRFIRRGKTCGDHRRQGNRTDYTYDTAGRRTSTMLPAVANGPGGPLVRPLIATTLNVLGAPVRCNRCQWSGHHTAVRR
ncbi:MAG: hypothetical protein IPI73_21685 [Betaproteobacteria bacterium]|nr:hypothetical protein [Betaproteobacteria bacterium]